MLEVGDPDAQRWLERAVGTDAVDEARLAQVQEAENGAPYEVPAPPVGRAGRPHPGEHQTQAAAALGSMYLRGDGVPQSNATARVYYEIAGRGDHADAIEVLGCFLWDGTAGYKRARNKAVLMWAWAAEKGGVGAMGRTGDVHYQKRDYVTAIKWFILAAKHGHLPSMHRLGEMYMDGIGTERQCEVAVSASIDDIRFLKSVAERLHPLADPLAQTAYHLYLYGSLSTAYLSYLMLAERGIEAAQVSVAWMIDRGEYPVPGPNGSDLLPETMTEWEVALAYWNRAANQGNVDARVKAGDYLLRGWGLQPTERVDDSEASSSTLALRAGSAGRWSPITDPTNATVSGPLWALLDEF
ncbi:ERAD-associated protein, partial [Gonapodya sp. JEL0774]